MSAGRTRRAWGWHPLDDIWAARVVSTSDVRANQLVYDIGAGTGALTAPLVDAGARVIAVEPHPDRARQLRARFSDAPVSVLQISAEELRLPRRPFRVVASPPYGIGSALLRRLLTERCGLYAADLVLPKSVVGRFVNGARATTRVPHRWRAHQGLTLPRRAFQPPPTVDSAVLVVRKRR